MMHHSSSDPPDMFKHPCAHDAGDPISGLFAGGGEILR